MHNPATSVTVEVNRTTPGDIERYLKRHSGDFSPPFATGRNLAEYAVKLCTHARRYEIWHAGELDALMAVYLNEGEGKAYVPYICTAGARSAERGLGSLLLARLLSLPLPYRTIELEVRKTNPVAVDLYKKFNFAPVSDTGEKLLMRLTIN